MKKINLVIGEEETEYAKKLAEYINSSQKESIAVEWYSSRENLLERISGNRAELYLLGEEFAEEEYIRQILSVGGSRYIALLVSDAADNRLADYPAICKYQSAEEIIREIYSCMADYMEDQSVWRNSNRMWLGVYAPWNYELSAFYARMLAELVGEKKRVLYISLQESLGTQMTDVSEVNRNLADVIAALRRQVKNPGALLKSVIIQENHVDNLPAVWHPQNLFEMTAEDYERLYTVIEEQLDYDVVVVEYGAFYKGILDWMERCSQVYCPYDGEMFERYREEQLARIFALSDRQKLFARLHFVKMPYRYLNISGMVDWTKLCYEEAGSYIREQVQQYGI